LYQGTTLVVLLRVFKHMGFSPWVFCQKWSDAAGAKAQFFFFLLRHD
jgi:hypothetical protein